MDGREVLDGTNLLTERTKSRKAKLHRSTTKLLVSLGLPFGTLWGKKHPKIPQPSAWRRNRGCPAGNCYEYGERVRTPHHPPSLQGGATTIPPNRPPPSPDNWRQNRNTHRSLRHGNLHHTQRTKKPSTAVDLSPSIKSVQKSFPPPHLNSNKYTRLSARAPRVSTSNFETTIHVQQQHCCCIECAPAPPRLPSRRSSV